MGKSRLCAELFAYVDERPGSSAGARAAACPTGTGSPSGRSGRSSRRSAASSSPTRPQEAEAKLEQALPRGRSRPRLAQGAPRAARRCARRARLPGGVVHRLAARSARSSRPRRDDGARLRGPALGRPGAALLPRAPGRLGGGRAAAAALHRAPGAVRAASRLRRERAQRAADQPRPADATRRRPAWSRALLERAVLPAETQQALLERAGGNPLYAEEFVRLLADRGELGEAVEVPDSVQALIAARLDTLGPERKSLLQDAAVLGKVFWAGALAAMGRARPGRGRAGAARALAQGARPPRSHELDGGRARVRLLARARARRLLRADPARRPRRPPPRGGRLDRGEGGRAGRGPGRRARPPLPGRARARPRGRARRADTSELRRRRCATSPWPASGRSRSTSNRPSGSLARALELAPAGHPERASLLERWAQAAQQQGRLQEAEAGARRGPRPLPRAGRAAGGRPRPDPPRARAPPARRPDEARRLLAEARRRCSRRNPPGRSSSAPTPTLAGHHTFAEPLPRRRSRPPSGRSRSPRSSASPSRHSRSTGAASPAAHLGDADGLEDLRRALQLALEQGLGRETAVIHDNLAGVVWSYEGPQAALDVLREGNRLLRAARHHRVRAADRAAEPATCLAELGQTRAGARRGRAARRPDRRPPAT